MNADGKPDHLLTYKEPNSGGNTGTRVKVALNNGNGFGVLQNWDETTTGYFSQWIQELRDMNADGRPDLVMRWKDADEGGSVGTRVRVKLNLDGTGFQAAYSDWDITTTGNYIPWTQQLVDMNGDGKPDHVRTWKESSGGNNGTRVQVALNNGSGFDTSVYWDNTTTGRFTSYKQQVIDMNGDGKPDLVQTYKGTDGTEVRVRINNGSGFNGASYWDNTNGTDYSSGDWKLQLVDMNGDGRLDYALTYKGTSGTRVRVRLNNGSGFNSVTVWDSTTGINYSSSLWTQQLVDMNGDGMLDHVLTYKDEGTNTGTRLKVALNTGSGFSAMSVWENTPTGKYTGWTQQLIDMNGDGKRDQLLTYRGSSGTRVRVALTNAAGTDSDDAVVWDKTLGGGSSGDISSLNFPVDLNLLATAANPLFDEETGSLLQGFVRSSGYQEGPLAANRIASGAVSIQAINNGTLTVTAPNGIEVRARSVLNLTVYKDMGGRAGAIYQRNHTGYFSFTAHWAEGRELLFMDIGGTVSGNPGVVTVNGRTLIQSSPGNYVIFRSDFTGESFADMENITIQTFAEMYIDNMFISPQQITIEHQILANAKTLLANVNKQITALQDRLVQLRKNLRQYLVNQIERSNKWIAGLKKMEEKGKWQGRLTLMQRLLTRLERGDSLQEVIAYATATLGTGINLDGIKRSTQKANWINSWNTARSEFLKSFGRYASLEAELNTKLGKYIDEKRQYDLAIAAQDERLKKITNGIAGGPAPIVMENGQLISLTNVFTGTVFSAAGAPIVIQYLMGQPYAVNFNQADIDAGKLGTTVLGKFDPRVTSYTPAGTKITMRKGSKVTFDVDKNIKKADILLTVSYPKNKKTGVTPKSDTAFFYIRNGGVVAFKDPVTLDTFLPLNITVADLGRASIVDRLQPLQLIQLPEYGLLPVNGQKIKGRIDPGEKSYYSVIKTSGSYASLGVVAKQVGPHGTRTLASEWRLNDRGQMEIFNGEITNWHGFEGILATYDFGILASLFMGAQPLYFGTPEALINWLNSNPEFKGFFGAEVTTEPVRKGNQITYGFQMSQKVRFSVPLSSLLPEDPSRRRGSRTLRAEDLPSLLGVVGVFTDSKGKKIITGGTVAQTSDILKTCGKDIQSCSWNGFATVLSPEQLVSATVATIDGREVLTSVVLPDPHSGLLVTVNAKYDRFGHVTGILMDGRKGINPWQGLEVSLVSFTPPSVPQQEFQGARRGMMTQRAFEKKEAERLSGLQALMAGERSLRLGSRLVSTNVQGRSGTANLQAQVAIQTPWMGKKLSAEQMARLGLGTQQFLMMDGTPYDIDFVRDFGSIPNVPQEQRNQGQGTYFQYRALYDEQGHLMNEVLFGRTKQYVPTKEVSVSTPAPAGGFGRFILSRLAETPPPPAIDVERLLEMGIGVGEFGEEAIGAFVAANLVPENPEAFDKLVQEFMKLGLKPAGNYGNRITNLISQIGGYEAAYGYNEFDSEGRAIHTISVTRGPDSVTAPAGTILTTGLEMTNVKFDEMGRVFSFTSNVRSIVQEGKLVIGRAGRGSKAVFYPTSVGARLKNISTFAGETRRLETYYDAGGRPSGFKELSIERYGGQEAGAAKLTETSGIIYDVFGNILFSMTHQTTLGFDGFDFYQRGPPDIAAMFAAYQGMTDSERRRAGVDLWQDVFIRTYQESNAQGIATSSVTVTQDFDPALLAQPVVDISNNSFKAGRAEEVPTLLITTTQTEILGPEHRKITTEEFGYLYQDFDHSADYGRYVLNVNRSVQEVVGLDRNERPLLVINFQRRNNAFVPVLDDDKNPLINRLSYFSPGGPQSLSYSAKHFFEGDDWSGYVSAKRFDETLFQKNFTFFGYNAFGQLIETESLTIVLRDFKHTQKGYSLREMTRTTTTQVTKFHYDRAGKTIGIQELKPVQRDSKLYRAEWKKKPKGIMGMIVGIIVGIVLIIVTWGAAAPAVAAAVASATVVTVSTAVAAVAAVISAIAMTIGGILSLAARLTGSSTLAKIGGVFGMIAAVAGIVSIFAGGISAIAATKAAATAAGVSFGAQVAREIAVKMTAQGVMSTLIETLKTSYLLAYTNALVAQGFGNSVAQIFGIVMTALSAVSGMIGNVALGPAQIGSKLTGIAFTQGVKLTLVNITKLAINRAVGTALLGLVQTFAQAMVSYMFSGDFDWIAGLKSVGYGAGAAFAATFFEAFLMKVTEGLFGKERAVGFLPELTQTPDQIEESLGKANAVLGTAKVISEPGATVGRALQAKDFWNFGFRPILSRLKNILIPTSAGFNEYSRAFYISLASGLAGYYGERDNFTGLLISAGAGYLLQLLMPMAHYEVERDQQTGEMIVVPETGQAKIKLTGPARLSELEEYLRYAGIAHTDAHEVQLAVNRLLMPLLQDVVLPAAVYALEENVLDDDGRFIGRRGTLLSSIVNAFGSTFLRVLSQGFTNYGATAEQAYYDSFDEQKKAEIVKADKAALGVQQLVLGRVITPNAILDLYGDRVSVAYTKAFGVNRNSVIVQFEASTLGKALELIDQMQVSGELELGTKQELSNFLNSLLVETALGSQFQGSVIDPLGKTLFAFQDLT
ncbi:MAG: VCBS repeat-containing protein, partial [Candidatus Omnitrophica bacterium]|nr:VCBS repeat-containing protein [Candidatus Omnitrophota bacterium]